MVPVPELPVLVGAPAAHRVAEVRTHTCVQRPRRPRSRPTSDPNTCTGVGELAGDLDTGAQARRQRCHPNSSTAPAVERTGVRRSGGHRRAPSRARSLRPTWRRTCPTADPELTQGFRAPAAAPPRTTTAQVVRPTADHVAVPPDCAPVDVDRHTAVDREAVAQLARRRPTPALHRHRWRGPRRCARNRRTSPRPAPTGRRRRQGRGWWRSRCCRADRRFPNPSTSHRPRSAPRRCGCRRRPPTDTPDERPVTGVGVDRDCVVPSPSWPEAFDPQHRSAVELSMAQVWLSPAATARTPEVMPGTATGVRDSTAVPSPS